MIESSKFGDDIQANERLVSGSRVILCTISMLSTDRIRGFTELVPVQTVIVDEASQIEVGDYLPMLAMYKKSLRKIVFIGDDKQRGCYEGVMGSDEKKEISALTITPVSIVAPYGQEGIQDLRSVFEWPHLMENSVFLDTQCAFHLSLLPPSITLSSIDRMPTVIGDFISRHVYDSELRTEHKIHAPTCCRFVNVNNGEEVKRGVSWMVCPRAHLGRHMLKIVQNEGEVKAAVQIARRYFQEGKNFRIITPYDAQRNAIEDALKAADIFWENTVFNVDSFQGNEEDHIIVSIVRTSGPGFMKNKRRTNVMLSRSKKSMMILTHREFLQYWDVAKTLVGLFAKEHVPKTGWVTLEDLAFRRW